jgi:predicted rRNA methylase YqxC with S4 and FtsJ domains
VYLGENVNKIVKQKAAQNVELCSCTLSFQKNHKELPKVAQLVKNCPIWLPCLYASLKVS